MVTVILAFFAPFLNWFGGIGSWLKANPVIAKILAVAVALFLLWWGKERWKRNIEKGVERTMREQQAREQAETRTAIVERTTQIITEERHNADDALAARDSGSAPATYAELPDQNRAIAEGRARSRFEGGQ